MKSTTSNHDRSIPLSEPVFSGNEWTYVKECLDTGWVSSVGSFVDRFEQAVATYLGVQYAVAVTNGTAALHLALLVLGVEPEDAVLVPTLTFIAPVNTVRYVGAHPVFFDCDPKTLCIDAAKVRAYLETECERRVDGYTYDRASGRKIRAMLPVHVFGHPADMDAFVALGLHYNVRVIEDATESLGSLYKGRKAGALGDIGCVSFNGNKIITTGGGGMLVTNNKVWADRVRHLSTQAKKDPLTYDHDAIGYNYRLTNVQSAIGVAQLEQLAGFVVRKRDIAARYRALFAHVRAVELMTEQPWATSNQWLNTIMVEERHRDPLMAYVRSHGIEARPIWKLIHTLPMYRGDQAHSITEAPRLYAQCLNIPSSISLEDRDIVRVVETIAQYYGAA